jgi:branched-chain amino acid aminotransferase
MKRHKVFLNGRWCDERRAAIPLSAEGILTGTGVFETMRALHGNIIGLDDHARRLCLCARRLGVSLRYSVEDIKKIVLRTVSINNLADAVVRVTVWAAGEDRAFFVVSARKYIPSAPRLYTQGIAACISDERIDRSSCVAGIKTTSYARNKYAYRQAVCAGYDEVLFLNTRGYLCEGSKTSLFFVRNDCLCTPALGCGCLDGITRKIILALARGKGVRVQEGSYTVKDILAGSEAFVTNSLMGILPLVSIDRRRIGCGKPGKVFTLLLGRYISLLNDERK